jgi:NAD(P)-dependent dehydrogenase (short-subunit alcohol dehydrogenase family)
MGRKVIVIGGSSGIGLGVASAALERGADVVIVGRTQAKLNAAVRTLGENVRLRAISAGVICYRRLLSGIP